MNIYNEITLCVYPSIQETADLIGDASTAEDKKAEPDPYSELEGIVTELERIV